MEILIDNVTKRFRGGTVALDGVCLTIHRGLFGLLGPNGAGKTTLMRILATLMRPDFGQVRVGGIDILRHPQEVRKFLGYLPQEAGYYQQLTGPEYLTLVAGMKGLRRQESKTLVDEALRLVRLDHEREKRIAQFSGGMKRRLGIAQAILGDPAVVIVDEPTAGLDPEERVRFRSLLAGLSQDRVVILSSHIVGDVESVCDQLAVLNRGRIHYVGSSDSLAAKGKGCVWQLELSDGEFERYQHGLQIVSSHRSLGRVIVRVVAPTNPLGAGTLVEPGLEEGYLCLMQEGAL